MQGKLWVRTGLPDMQDIEVDAHGRMVNVCQHCQGRVNRIGEGAGVRFHHQGQAFVRDATGECLQASGQRLALPPVKLGAALIAGKRSHFGCLPVPGQSAEVAGVADGLLFTSLQRQIVAYHGNAQSLAFQPAAIQPGLL